MPLGERRSRLHPMPGISMCPGSRGAVQGPELPRQHWALVPPSSVPTPRRV